MKLVEIEEPLCMINVSDKIISIIEIIYLFFLCSTISNAGYSISYALLIICMVICLAKTHKNFQFPDKQFISIYLVFMCSLVIAAMLSGDGKSLQSTIKYIYWTLPFFVLYTINQRSFYHQSVQWGTSLASIILSGYVLFIFFFLPHGERISGFFRNPNDYAMVVEMFLPFIFASICKNYQFQRKKIFSFSNWSNIFNIIAFVISVFGIFLSKSRGGIAGFLFGAAVLIILNILLNKKYVVSKIKILFACCILCFVATGLIVVMTQHYQRGYDYERVLLVQSSYKMWNDHKLYGVGYSRWQKEYKEKYISPEAKEPDLPMPHNTFAEYFSTTGVIGGLGYSIFVFGSIIILIKKMKEDITNPYIQALLWVSISILAHGLVDAGLRNKFVARLYFGFWGITLASVYNWTYWKSQFFQCKEMIIKK